MVWTLQKLAILRRGGKNTQKNYIKKHLTDSVITHLEPDILECEVKWTIGSITIKLVIGSIRTKLVEVMEFQLNYSKY